MDGSIETKRISGSPETAAWFREQLEAIGQTQSGLAKLMKRCGDDRQPATILRNIQRMALGEARISGEMRVMLHFLRRGKEKRREAAEQPASASSGNARHEKTVGPSSA